jgi:hypothetical protein
MHHGTNQKTYTYLDEQSFKYLFQALVRPHIEYTEAVWSPFKVGDIEKIEYLTNFVNYLNLLEAFSHHFPLVFL